MATYYKALELDGVNENVDCGNALALQITNNLSVVVWIYCGGQGTSDYIAMKYWTNQMSWAMRTGSADSTKLYVQVSTDGTTGPTKSKAYESPTATLSPGWHQVGFSFGSSTLKSYVDGVDITSTCTKHQDPAMSTLHNSTQNVELFGFTGYSNSNWTGKACNVFMCDSGVMTAADFLAQYNSGDNMDPEDLAFTGSAARVSGWLRNTTLPLVPGAGDIPDNIGSSTGTSQNMEVGDVVDSPWEYNPFPSGAYVCPQQLQVIP